MGTVSRIFWGMLSSTTHNFGIMRPEIDSTTTFMLKVFIWKNFVADFSVQIADFCKKTDKFAFFSTLWGT